MTEAVDNAAPEDQELLSAMEELQRAQERVAKLREQNRVKAIADVVEKIRMYDLKPEELGFAPATTRSGAPRRSGLSSTAQPSVPGGGVPQMIEGVKADGRSQVKAKYQGPDGQGWSGRGKPPTWMVPLLEAGAKKEDFLVKSDVAVNNKE
ncbi:H-NS family nucleoid-associated regulatory protein [Massilia jejuensis]|uniref:H-NS family nucleoid-associated regulatory protein n=1 Tax=Massilia jejuensis TaxID=648894 RepID=A0ABW0PKJ5_9BURK